MSLRLTAVFVPLLLVVTSASTGARGGRSVPDESGQATAEYALVLLGVAALAILVMVWATKTGVITRLFEAVFEQIQDRIKSPARPSPSPSPS